MSVPKAVKTEAFFDLPFPPEAVWGVFSKTDWLNRAVGLPAVSYELSPLPEGGARAIARARFCGVTMEWEEKSFEWVEPEYHHVERIFQRGPIRSMFGGIEFHPTDEGTRLRVFSEFLPRNAVGILLARSVLAPMATGGMAALARHAADFLRGSQAVCFPKLARAAVNEASLGAAMQKLRVSVTDESLAALLEAFVREAPDVELARIRPFSLARKWGRDRWETLRLLLQGTRVGLLDLSWEVLCPNCRSSRQPLATALAEISRSVHCEACQIKFDAEFDRSVELKFVINSQIRQCDNQTFCLAGPSAKPHILTQIAIPPGGERSLKLPARREGLRLRSPQVKDILDLAEIPEGRALICTVDGFAFEKSEVFGARNPNSFPVVLMLERERWSDDILTAARVANCQEFRDLFSREVVSPTEQIVVGQQVILFTDLRGSTSMYCGIGDAPAYALVRDHFLILRNAIAEHHGAIVKTIGDAVMASFSDPHEALDAVRQMHFELAASRRQPALKLKSSLHIGPCLAVNANERLDYFGTTVNLAARLVDCCEGGDLTTSDDFFKRTETQSFLARHELAAMPLEMKFRGFTDATKIWRIPITGSTQVQTKES